VRRLLRRLAIGLLVVVLALTVAAGGYDLATAGRDRAGTKLYAGPFVEADGKLVAYRRWGSRGTPIVLVGGFAEASWVWNRVGRLLARRHRVYALDLPPFGYTERRGPYTESGWVGLVRAFDRRLGIDRPVVVGHSLGAGVAVAYALWHPRELRGIVLLDGDALGSGGGPRWLSYLLVPPWYTAVYRLATGSDWIVRRALSSAYGPDAPRLDEAELERWERPFRVEGTAAAFRELLGNGLQGFRLDELRGVRVPRVVVWGAEDHVDDVSAGRTTARTVRARFVLVPRAGHLSMLAQPGAVAAAVERFAGGLRPRH
jgi:pimeloyl-ACP methyl ester carboxylesterase